MKGLLSALVCAVLAATRVSAVSKITRSGKYLYDSSGTRFFIKGIAYQEAGQLPSQTVAGEFPEPTTFVDPLAQPSACDRDIPYLKQLSVNAVRIYSVDASADHSHCMSALSAAGIYTIIDLSLPVNGSITRDAPTWTSNLLTLYLDTIDAFSTYDNVLAFNIGNEIVTEDNSTIAAPFIKAAARDVKAYLTSKGSSALVGYASTDGTDWRNLLADYLNCGSTDTSIDLWGLNDYRWCGDTGSVADDYQESIDAFTDLPSVSYLSEYGCNTVTPRTWTEVPAIFGSQMSAVYSGGVAFSYFPTNDATSYGIVTVSGSTVTTSTEFTNLEAQLTNVTFLTTPAQGSGTTPSLPTCPTLNGTWLASTSLPPTPNQAECNCFWADSPCVFTPQTVNQSSLFSELFAEGCTLLGQNGGNCDAIGQNGTTGTYGEVGSCDGASKLTWIFSQFYLATNNNAQSCNFAGNATVNSAAPTTVSAVNAAVSSCLAATPSVYTPTTPTTTLAPGEATGTQTGSSSHHNGATELIAHGQAILGISVTLLCILGGGIMLV